MDNSEQNLPDLSSDNENDPPPTGGGGDNQDFEGEETAAWDSIDSRTPLQQYIDEFGGIIPVTPPERPEVMKELGDFHDIGELAKLLSDYSFSTEIFETPSLEIKRLKHEGRQRCYSDFKVHLEVLDKIAAILTPIQEFVSLPEEVIQYLSYWAAAAHVQVLGVVSRLAYLKAMAHIIDGDRYWPGRDFSPVWEAAVQCVYLVHLVEGIEVSGQAIRHTGDTVSEEVEKRACRLNDAGILYFFSRTKLDNRFRKFLSTEHDGFRLPFGKKRSKSDLRNTDLFGYEAEKEELEKRIRELEREDDLEDDAVVESSREQSEQPAWAKQLQESLMSVVTCVGQMQKEMDNLKTQVGSSPVTPAASSVAPPGRLMPPAPSGFSGGPKKLNSGPIASSTPAPTGSDRRSGRRSSSPGRGTNPFHGIFSDARMSGAPGPVQGAPGGKRVSFVDTTFTAVPNGGSREAPPVMDLATPPPQTLKTVAASSDRGIPCGVINRSSYKEKVDIVRQRKPRRELFRDANSYTGNRFVVDKEELSKLYIALPYPYNVVPYRKKEKQIVEYSKMVNHDENLKFNGSIDSFLSWSPAFLSSIHIVQDMSEIEKLFALRASIDFAGPAGHELTVIFHTDYSSLAYFEVVTDLIRKFGDPDILLAQQQMKLQTYRLDCNSYHSCNKFYYLLKRYAMSQEHIGQSTILDNTTLLANMLGCFTDKRERRNFSAFAKSERLPECLDTFILFIEKNVEELESINIWEKFDTRSLMQSSSSRGSSYAKKSHGYATLEEEVEYKLQKMRPEESNEESGPNVTFAVGSGGVVQEHGADQVFKTGDEERSCDVPACKEKHPLWKCDVFKKMKQDQKRDIVVAAKRCFRCLGYGHVLKDCKSKYGGCKSCKDDKHHSDMCQAKPYLSAFYSYEYVPYFQLDEPGVDKVCTITEVSCSIDGTVDVSKAVVSLRTIPIRFRNPRSGVSLVFVTLMDDGSTGMYLSRRACELLGLKGEVIEITLSTVANKLLKITTIKCSVVLESLDESFETEVTVVILDDMVEDLLPVDWEKAKHKFAHLKDVSFPPLPEEWPDKVDCILGVKRPDLTRCLKEVSGPPGHPIARRTPFGFTAVGLSDPDVDLESVDRANLIYRVFDSSIIDYGVGVSDTGEKFFFEQGELVSAERVIKDQDQPGIYTARAEVQDSVPLVDEEQLEDALPTLEDQIQRFWAAEEPPKQEKLTIANQYTENRMKDQCRIVDGKCELPCTWKPGHPNESLVNNRRVILASLKRLVKSLSPELWGFYDQVFVEWLQENIIVEVPPGDGTQQGVYYLDHFGVLRPDKPTCPIRPVLNAKKKYKGVSLNDCLLEGPNRLNDLRIVLLRACLEDYIFTCDIKGMFLQIRMQEKDQEYHRILWQSPEDKEVKEYKFLRHVFGNKGSPFVSQFCIQHTAEQFKDEHPRAVETVQKSTLMDDNFDSFESYEEMVQVNEGLQVIYGSNGMKLTKYASNSKEFMATIDEGVRMPVKQIEPVLGDETDRDGRPLPSAKILGMQIDFESDVVCYKIKDKLLDSSGEWTKRRCSSVVSSVYDPLGRISPVILQGRILLQSLWWVEDLDWDDKIPAKVEEPFKKWIEGLVGLKQVKIPRPLKVFGKKVVKRILLGFGDASQLAYGVAVYVRCEYEDGTASCHLAYGSGRVSPLNKYTIPRLELMAASKLVSDMAFVNKALSLPTEDLVYFSDSHTVLAWISATSRMMKDSISYTVATIQRETRVSAWNYVPTDQNPADIASRGMVAKDLVDSKLWWSGPDFCNEDVLVLPEFPKHLPRDTEDYLREMIKPDELAFLVDSCEIRKSVEFTDFPLSADNMSNISKLVRLTAYCLRFLMFRKQPVERFTPFKKLLNVIEYRRAFHCLIRGEQMRWYKEVFDFLGKYDQVKKGSPLSGFAPFVDVDTGLLKSNTRLQYADTIPDYTKFPIILPHKSALTALIIRFYHQVRCGHAGGVSMTLDEFSVRYVAIAAKELVTREVKYCRKCQDLNARPQQQKIAPLPLERLPTDVSGSGNTVFESCGLDYFGPFMVSMGRGLVRQKRWVLLFTCLRFRAVRLIVTQDYSADWTLKAVESFLAANPRPKKFLSDQGSQLKAASKSVTWAMREGEVRRLINAFPAIDWCFTPVATPHFGGAWERLVGLAKRCLLGLAPEMKFTDLEFVHLLARVEGFLNRRPLSYIVTDNNSIAPLTPNHFLAGKALQEVAPAEGLSLFDSYDRVLKALNLAWKRYLREIIPQLRSMEKWKRERDNLSVDDIVMVLSDTNERGMYPLARVVEVHESEDGYVRQVKVKMGETGKVKDLSLSHMCPLKLTKGVAQDYF